MKTVIKISWRNIWRNKLRSLTVIISMVLGLFCGLFAVSMMLGLNDQRMGSAVDSYLSHIQIHHPSFNENFDIKHTVENFDSLKRNRGTSIATGKNARSTNRGRLQETSTLKALRGE